MERTCERCGKPLVRPTARQRFCSWECSSPARKLRPVPKDKPRTSKSVARDRPTTKLSYPLAELVAAEDYPGVVEYLEANTRKDGGCWIWEGSGNRGYPEYPHRTGTLRVHRVALEAKLGKPLGYLTAHHVCANSMCVNPEHLQPVTNLENVAEMQERRYYRNRIAELEAALAKLDPGHPLLSEASLE